MTTTFETRMADTAPNPELLRSLGRLVRGLSAIFWGLPLALIVCVQCAKTEMLRTFNVVPPIAVTAWLFYGLLQLGHFQRQERIWRHTLDRAKMLALINLGLSPFLFWWNQRPGEQFFTGAIEVLALSGLFFLSSLNLVLYRLSAMLPDEGVRQETKYFTSLNRHLVLAIILLGLIFYLLMRFPQLLPVNPYLSRLLGEGGLWLTVFLVLLPVAMTMAMVWKIKEMILDSVFGPGH